MRDNSVNDFSLNLICAMKMDCHLKHKSKTEDNRRNRQFRAVIIVRENKWKVLHEMGIIGFELLALIRTLFVLNEKKGSNYLPESKKR